MLWRTVPCTAAPNKGSTVVRYRCAHHHSSTHCHKRSGVQQKWRDVPTLTARCHCFHLAFGPTHSKLCFERWAFFPVRTPLSHLFYLIPRQKHCKSVYAQRLDSFMCMLIKKKGWPEQPRNANTVNRMRRFGCFFTLG